MTSDGAPSRCKSRLAVAASVKYLPQIRVSVVQYFNPVVVMAVDVVIETALRSAISVAENRVKRIPTLSVRI